MARDYIRYCKTCGHRWRVSKAVAKVPKPPGGLEMAGRKMMAAGSSMTIGSRQRAANQLRLGNAEARLQMAAMFQCPSCGSGKFKQVPEGWQSRQEDERLAKQAAKKQARTAAKAAKKRDSEKKDPPRTPATRSKQEEQGRAAPSSAAPSFPKQDLPPPPPATPGGWQPDPTGRHELRMWTGTAWTYNVSDAGTSSLDPI